MNRLKAMTWKQWAAIVGVFAVTTLLPACIRQFKVVDVPVEVQVLGAPDVLTLEDTPAAQAQYASRHAFIMDTWEAAEATVEAEALWWEGVISAVSNPTNLASIGINPVGGVVSSILLLGGLMTRRPGDEPRDTAKQESYNKGMADAQLLFDFAKVTNGHETPTDAQPTV